MNEKISFPDLVALLAAKLNVTKKEAEAFLKEFFTVSTEVISSGDELRINDLGVFKPIWVEPRSSVNVQTGEPVEIPGHYKLSFVPDKVLREAVNAPFSSFSVEILNDHVSTEEMMAVGDGESLDDRDEEVSVQPGKTEVVEESAAQEPEEQEEEISDVDTVEETIVEDTSTSEVGETSVESRTDVGVMEPESVSDPAPVSYSEPELSAEEKSEPESRPEAIAKEELPEPEELPLVDKESEEENPLCETHPQNQRTEEVDDYHEYLQKSSSRIAFWWGALSCLGLVVVIGVAAWFFLRGDGGIKIGEYTLSLTNSGVFASQTVENNIADTVVVPEPMDTTTVVESLENDTLPGEAVAQNVKSAELEKIVASAPEQPAAKPVVETIRSGVFLTTLARKYFGHKTFWVYIYEENKGVITNPNQVPIGTRIVIPDASKYHIDAKDPQSVETAKALAVKILSKYE